MAPRSHSVHETVRNAGVGQAVVLLTRCEWRKRVFGSNPRRLLDGETTPAAKRQEQLQDSRRRPAVSSWLNGFPLHHGSSTLWAGSS